MVFETDIVIMVNDGATVHCCASHTRKTAAFRELMQLEHGD